MVAALPDRSTKPAAPDANDNSAARPAPARPAEAAPSKVIIASNKYSNAHEKAITTFHVLGEYKDSAKQATFAEVGDYVWFGSYEQDNDTSNGKEDIEWLVLDKQDNKLLLLSRYGLDAQPYNTEWTDITWENCTLRKWLNNDFINAAFSADEKAMIPTVTVSADKNPDYSTNPGNSTSDNVFLLSITEAEKYFSDDDARMCAPTDYAIARGAWQNDNYKTVDGLSTCWWWLRSPGGSQNSAASVNRDGDVSELGSFVNIDIGAVRPALWINLES